MKTTSIGYIAKMDSGYELKEAPYTVATNSRGEKTRSKTLTCSVRYDEAAAVSEKIKSGDIVTEEPFILDDETREAITKWIEEATE